MPPSAQISFDSLCELFFSSHSPTFFLSDKLRDTNPDVQTGTDRETDQTNNQTRNRLSGDTGICVLQSSASFWTAFLAGAFATRSPGFMFVIFLSLAYIGVNLFLPRSRTRSQSWPGSAIQWIDSRCYGMSFGVQVGAGTECCDLNSSAQ
ncbi:hypothetical protein K438DRAFT_1767489 [Mycena galopus ATCC 62051]|nr:hypothetical protein K438DRAFT_1767489 [Mycena galopus ATCC 62051]